MVAFNFAAEHAGAVERGEKMMTIRAKKRGKPGDLCQLYTGQRTKACRKLVTPDPVLKHVSYCAIRAGYLTLGDTSLFPGNVDDFARLDGFKNYIAMVEWFSKRYGTQFFCGFVHVWETANAA